MSKTDLLLTVILAALAVLGYFSGFLRSVVRLLASFIALGLSYALAGPFGDFMMGSFPAAGILIKPIMISLVFAVSLFAALVLTNMLENIAEDNNFGVVNRVFGGLLGVAKGLGFAWLVLWMLNMLPDQGYFGTVKSDSRYYKYYVDQGYGETGLPLGGAPKRPAGPGVMDEPDPSDPFAKPAHSK